MKTQNWRAILQLVLTIVLALLGKSRQQRGRSRTTTRSPSTSPRVKSSPRIASRGQDGGIAKLFAEGRSDAIVTSSGLVVKILRDDLHDDDGSGQHQQFLVEVPGDVTIKIAHNLKFGRVPVNEGDTIRFKGEYEWNDRGGCVHWTHHDPKGWHEDGWIEHEGKRYS